MAFQVSAGVEVKEIDLTNVVPAVSTSIGGYAGPFRWGPIEEITLVGSETELVNQFGKPKSVAPTNESFFTAASFLKYGNALKVVRTTDSALKNSVAAGVGGSLTKLAFKADSPVKGSSLENITSASGLISDFVITSDNGSGAEVAPNYQVGGQATAAGTRANGISIASAGSGYTKGNVVGVDLGEGKVLPIRITNVNGSGGVTLINTLDVNSPATFTVVTPTQFSSVATTAASANTSPASGSGFLVDLTYHANSFTVLSGGSGYQVSSVLSDNDTPNFKLFGDGTLLFPVSGDSPSTYDGTSDNNAGSNLAPTISATSSATAALIKNEDSFEAIKGTLTGDIFSRYAGALGNSTRVYIVNAANAGSIVFNGTTNKVSDQFDAAPTGNELHIMITSTADEFTGNGTVETEVEKWAFLNAVSTSKDADGSSNYYVNVINESSEWIYIPSAISSVTTLNATTGVFALSNGVDQGTTVTAGDVVSGLDLFNDPENEDVGLLFSKTDANGDNTIGNKVLAVATARKDTVGFVSPAIDDTKHQTETNALTNVKDYKASLSAPDSYGVMGSTSAYIYDKYNDQFLYIGTQGHLAGLCANTDRVAEAWFSPGGFNRGQLKGVTKLAFNPKKATRDELYKAGINPIVTFPGQGTVLFGDKTLQSKPSAFDRINVRRLFITLEKAIATAAKFQLFELNDEFTRATFRNLVEPFLRDVQGRRGITDFLVVCDETNNTGQVIDSNRFVADIFIKPARSINFITLNFIATRTGVEFSEIVGNV